LHVFVSSSDMGGGAQVCACIRVPLPCKHLHDVCVCDCQRPPRLRRPATPDLTATLFLCVWCGVQRCAASELYSVRLCSAMLSCVVCVAPSCGGLRYAATRYGELRCAVLRWVLLRSVVFGFDALCSFCSRWFCWVLLYCALGQGTTTSS
jgi:hypothetical protein